MSHEILGDRFLGKRAGWHQLGKVIEADLTAGEAYVEHIGRYDVTLEPIVAGESRLVVFPDRRAIVRHPIPEDDQFRCFGMVTDQYGLVTPDQAVGLWDRKVTLSVETMFVIRQGECLVISAKLPTFDVNGDEIEDYLQFHNWMDGSHMAQMVRAPIRVVCRNTMRMSEDAATETYRARHTRDILTELETWLEGFVVRAVHKQAALKEACELLANTRATQTRVEPVLQAAYPDPIEPSRDAPEDVVKLRMEEYEHDIEIVDERRATVLDLFGGEGRGADSRAADGTMWGIYQAVAECENFRRGGSDRQAAESVLVGSRGDTIARTFDKCQEVSRS